MQDQAARMSNFSSAESQMARRLNLPPSYLLIHRVTFGSIGVLCQLDAIAPFREIVDRYLAGFTDERREPSPAGHHHSWSRFASIDREMLPYAGRAHPARAAAVLLLDHPGEVRDLGAATHRTGHPIGHDGQATWTLSARRSIGTWDRRPGTSAPPRSANG